MKTRNLGYLLSTASVAAFACAGAVSADQNVSINDYTGYHNVSINDYADLSGYENIIDINFDTKNGDIEIESLNGITAEGALGASNDGVNQIALTQFVNVAAQTDSENDTIIDLSHDFSVWDEESFFKDELKLGSKNTALAKTSVFDAIIGGSQVAVTSFNTASLDIDAADDNSSADVALLQEIDANWDFAGEDGYDMTLSARNDMLAVVSIAGTATINSLNDEGKNGIQQAALSVNTFSLSSEVDTFIELAGQQGDPNDFLEGEDDVGEFGLIAGNIAGAYSPLPATSEFVDPRLATDLNDPSINNLDQIAAISINTMSFGNAANSEEEIAASTANFEVLSYTNTFGEDFDPLYGPPETYGLEANGQDAEFDDDKNDLILGNIMVATTIGEDFIGLSDGAPFGDDFGGLGDVAIDNASQVTALTINSITNAGQGELTLKETTAFGSGYAIAEHGDFDQKIDGLTYESGIENIAYASTESGDANVSNLEQVAQYSFNSISSGGDLNGWNDSDQTNGIEQDIDIDFFIQDEDIQYFGNNSPYGLGLNTAIATTMTDSAAVSDVRQILQLSMNTISVDGNMTTGLYQDINDRELYMDNVNVIAAFGLGGGESAYSDNAILGGGASIDTAEQIALFNFNTLSVEGVLNSDQLYQDFDADDVRVEYASLNTADSTSFYGDATASDVQQTAQMTFNSVAAGSLAGTDSSISSIDQSFDELENVNLEDINNIYVSSEEQGNAIVADSSQAFILNANSVSFDNSVNGEISQDVDDINLGYNDITVNSTYAHAHQDDGDARWMGGNASIEGLTQSLAISMNTISAGSMGGATISQYADDIDIKVGNYAYADAEYGVASITGVTQQTINRINSISITPVSFN